MKSTPLVVGQVIMAIAATIAGLYFLRSILIPWAVAFVLTVLVSALVRWIVRRWPRAPRWAVVGLAGGMIGLGAAGGMYIIAQGAIHAIHRGPAVADRIDLLVGQAGRMLGFAAPLRLDDLIGRLSIAQIAGGVLSSAQDVLSGLVLTIIYFGFMLASRARIAPKIRNITASSADAGTLRAGIARIEAQIETYIWVQTVTGAMLAVASGLVMAALGLDDVAFWTIVLFLLSYIPTIGVTVGSVAPALFALLQFPTAWQGIAIFVGIQAVAFVVGNLIYPRLQAETQNIDPVAVILALSFWTFLWGIPGAFLAVPITLILAMICAQSRGTRWIAVLLSHDGKPAPPVAADMAETEHR